MNKLSLCVAGLVLLGCGTNPGRNPDPVEVSGRVTVQGKPVSDVVLNLQPTSRGALALLPVKNGEFRGTVMPGKYTYYLSEGSKPAALNAIPEKYRSGSLDRQTEVSGGTLNLTLD